MTSEITPAQLKSRLDEKEDIDLLDVREKSEFEICKLDGSTLIPVGDIPKNTDKINREKPVVVICHHGIRSAQIIMYLMQRQGYTNLLNLKGGIHAWAKQIDPNMQTY